MKNTTRILTWNLGLFPWCHWGDSLRVSINGNPVRHEFFQKANGNFIAEKIREINPDICVLEEFKKESDRVALKQPHPSSDAEYICRNTER